MPFGEHVEGLSYFRDKTYVVEGAVQTDDFQQQALFRDVGRKPFVRKGLRKFKHFHRQVGPLGLLAAFAFELGQKACFFRAQFGLFGGECIRFDFVQQPQIEQTLFLLADVGQFAVQRLPLGCRRLLCGFRLCSQYADDPPADLFVLNPHLAEQRQDLLVELRFADPYPRMVPLVVAGAAIVAVLARAAGRLFVLDFHNDRPATVAAADHTGPVDRIPSVIGLFTEQQLHAIERVGVHNRLVRAWMPAIAILHFADVGAVAKDCMQLAACKRRLLGRVVDSLFSKLLSQAVQRVAVIGVQFERPADGLRRLRINHHHAATVLPAIGVAIRGFADEQPVLHATRQALTHIDTLLLGVERGHVGQDAALHTPRRRVFRRLGDVNHRHAVVGFQALQFDVIEQITGGAVYFVEQHAV